MTGLANRYANLVGSNKIKDEWQKINAGFDKVQQEMDAKPDKSIAQVNNVQMGTDDTLTIEGSTGITISTNPEQKKVIITATGTSTPGPHGSAHSEFGADPIPLATTTEGGLMSAADKTKLNNATSAATPNTLVQRDPAGRFKAGAPAASDDVARKAEVDAALPKSGGTMTGQLEIRNKMPCVKLFDIDSNNSVWLLHDNNSFYLQLRDANENWIRDLMRLSDDGLTRKLGNDDIWDTGRLRINNGTLEYNDGGVWRPVGGIKGVQKGRTTIYSPTYTVDVPISEVNVSKAYVVVPQIYSRTTTVSDYSGEHYAYAELLNSTTLRIGGYSAGGNSITISWQVVEFY